MSEFYKIVKNDVFGRYMVASKPIKQGQLILKDTPVLISPLSDGIPVCFNCYSHIRIKYIFCEKCDLAILCHQDCIGKFHKESECNQLKNLGFNKKALIENTQVITALRLILFKKWQPDIWQEICELEPHLEKRRDTPIWKKYKYTIERVLKEMGFLNDEDVRNELIQKVHGILDVNTFEVRPAQNGEFGAVFNPEVQCLRGLYLKAALMAHDCVSNTHLAVDNDFVMSIHASTNIEENQPIFFNYANVLQGNFERKQHLREGKYFECCCKRCTDPKELTTNLSSLICPKCKRGKLQPNQPGNPSTIWECNSCKMIYQNILIKLTINEAKRQMETLDPFDIQDMENLLKKLLLTFDKNHYLILEIEQNLVGLYTQGIPSKKNLTRKINLCNHLLDIFKTLEPGISRIQAITMYELHSAKTNLAHKLFTNKEINAEEFIRQLLNAENVLNASIKYLLYEPIKSPEGVLTQKALSELKMLRNSIAGVKNTLFSNSIINKKDPLVEDVSRTRSKKIKNRKNN